jgi:glycosyltransferase involved in cell wall biosynthesis
LLWQQYASKHLQKNIKHSTKVITYSKAVQNELENLMKLDKEKYLLIPYTVNQLFQPMEWHDKLYIKSRFAENKEFFVAVLPDNDEKKFTELLKAFSKFKKWQQSNMQLLLLPKEESFSSAIESKLDLYKYKSDVKLINDADNKETANIIATAYAILHFSQKDADLWPVAAAIQCATPVISFNNESIIEYCGEAGLFAGDAAYDTFGDLLIRLYKDETLRSKMSEAALEQVQLYNQKEYAIELWQLLNQA